jgi:chromosome segregation ATPase
VTEPRRQLGSGRDAEENVELKARLRARERHLEELHDELAKARLEADEQRAARVAAEERVRALERRASVLDKRVRYYQREERARSGVSRREQRRARRLGRALDRREAEKLRLKERLSVRGEELSNLRSRERSLSARRDDALERAVRRVRELERELDKDQEVHGRG